MVIEFENGNYKLGVYIVDVSYYVKEGFLIDVEVVECGISVYLVDWVILMIFYCLFNGICLLNLKVNCFMFLCEMEIDL